MNVVSGFIYVVVWVDVSGCIGWVCEDVGCYNVLDKLIGVLYYNEYVIEGGLLVIFSWVSYEMVSKVVCVGVSVLVVVLVLIVLVIDLVCSVGLCLVGFVWESGFNVYIYVDWLQVDDGYVC